MAPSLPFLLLLVCGLNVAHSKIRIYGLSAKDLPSDVFSSPDPYVKVICASTTLGQTQHRKDTKNPVWGEEFAHSSAKENDVLILEVYDRDLMFDDLIGTCRRQVKVGTHKHTCYLDKGGTLYYSYTLSR